MSITSVNGTASSVQALLSALNSGDSLSATFSLSSSATDTTADSGLSDSDVANAFQMMSAAMQSALIASQGGSSAGFSTTDDSSLDQAFQPPPPPPPGSFDISATSASASGSDSTSDDVSAGLAASFSSSVDAASSSATTAVTDSASFEALVAGLMAPPPPPPAAETTATSSTQAVSAVAGVSSSSDSGLDENTAALYADLDQLLSDLTRSAATSAAATGGTVAQAGGLDSILAKYQSGDTTGQTSDKGNFATQLAQEMTRAIGSYGQSGSGSTSSGSISV